MAIENGYIVVVPGSLNRRGGGHTLGNRVHSQVDCPQIRRPEDLAVATVEQVDGKTRASWRGHSQQVTWCNACPPERTWAWQDRAKCKHSYPAVDMLELERGHSAAPLIEEFCKPCPVRRECANFALAGKVNDLVGIWGGVFIPFPSGGKGARMRKRAIQALKVEAGIITSLDAA